MTPEQKALVEEFKNKLEKHDIWYEMVEGDTWRRGHNSFLTIQSIEHKICTCGLTLQERMALIKEKHKKDFFQNNNDAEEYNPFPILYCGLFSKEELKAIRARKRS